MPKPDLTDAAVRAKAWEVFDSLPDGTTKAEARALIEQALTTPDLPPEPTTVGTIVLIADAEVGSIWQLEDLTNCGRPGRPLWMTPSWFSMGSGQTWAELCAMGTPQILRPMPLPPAPDENGAYRIDAWLTADTKGLHSVNNGMLHQRPLAAAGFERLAAVAAHLADVLTATPGGDRA